MKKIVFYTLLAFSFSCSNKTTETDTQAPAVTITAPGNNQVFTAGQSVNIMGSVTDNRYIKQIHIEITNFNTGEEYQHVHIHPAAASFAFNQPYTLQAGITYKIRVIADDASANSFAQQVQITCN